MKKLLFGLLCFSLVSISYADSVSAKRVKKSSVSKKKRAAKKRALRKRALKYRAYKSFYRKQVKQLRQKSYWSAGVSMGLPLSSTGLQLKPVGLSVSYAAMPFLAFEASTSLNLNEIDIKSETGFGDTTYRLDDIKSISGFVKLQKYISRQALTYIKLGYSIMTVDAITFCFDDDTGDREACSSIAPDKIENESLGLLAVGIGGDFFIQRKFSLGVEVLTHFGLKKALQEKPSNDFQIEVKDPATIKISAKYHF